MYYTLGAHDARHGPELAHQQVYQRSLSRLLRDQLLGKHVHCDESNKTGQYRREEKKTHGDGLSVYVCACA